MGVESAMVLFSIIFLARFSLELEAELTGTVFFENQGRRKYQVTGSGRPCCLLKLIDGFLSWADVLSE